MKPDQDVREVLFPGSPYQVFPRQVVRDVLVEEFGRADMEVGVEFCQEHLHVTASYSLSLRLSAMARTSILLSEPDTPFESIFTAFVANTLYLDEPVVMNHLEVKLGGLTLSPSVLVSLALRALDIAHRDLQSDLLIKEPVSVFG